MSTFDLAAYERHMALSQAHATIAQSIKYPMTVNKRAVSDALAYIKASDVLSRQMLKPQDVKA